MTETAAPTGEPATGGALLPPPAPGRPVAALDGALPDSALFVVRYCDDTYAFENGSWGRFGRCDGSCTMPVWEELNERRLSRVAGEFWCADGELWLRNLSTSHELALVGGGEPQWLPRRRGTHGAACTVTGRFAKVMSPSTGSWAITIEQRTPAEKQQEDRSTLVVGTVPGHLMPVAVALCAPVLERGDPPATYEQVARVLGITRRQARRQVEALCEHYAADGVVLPDDETQTPEYSKLAQLLVRRGEVGPADLSSVRTVGRGA